MRRAPLPGRGVLGGFASVLGGLVGILGGLGTLYADDWACVPSLGGGGREEPAYGLLQTGHWVTSFYRQLEGNTHIKWCFRKKLE